MSLYSWLGRRGPRARAEEILPGIWRLTMDTAVLRLHHLCSSPYLVDDLLIDTGPSHLEGALLSTLGERPVRAIALTHHHEDHSGNAGRVAALHDAPVYLRAPELRATEGTARLLPYRRVYWGWPGPYEPLPMPAELRGSGRVLEAIPTPGHCVTHTAFFDPSTGIALTGDLFLSPGPSAVLRYEQPLELVRSLRALADRKPRLLLTGHHQVVERGTERLLAKAERVEEAVGRARALHDKGWSRSAIVRALFKRGTRHDLMASWITFGEYGRHRFVETAIESTRGDA